MSTYIFQGSKLQLGDISQTLTAASVTLTAVTENGKAYVTYDDAEAGSVVYISTPEYEGYYFVTEYDGPDKLSQPVIAGLDADAIDDMNAIGIELGQVVTTEPCWITNLSLDVGQWNTESSSNICETVTQATTFERGTVTIEFTEDWDIEMQNVWLSAFQDKAFIIPIILQPFISGEGLADKVEFTSAQITGLSFDRSSVYSGTMTLQIQQKVERYRVAKD